MAKDTNLEFEGAKFDMRTPEQRISEFLSKPEVACSIFVCSVFLMFFLKSSLYFVNLIFIINLLFYFWYRKLDIGLEYKYPLQSKGMKHHPECSKADGMMFLGNQKKKGAEDNRELWISNSDARTHILFLGTTGSGKTEGLKLLSTNALTWGSGFVYVDGKADTDLWASLYSLARRFGREDDLLLLNYMTGNSDDGGKSNSMNPFANGSASYLTNLLVGLMDEAGGDNAMWKGRAISLMTAIMPALTWQRDHEGLLLDVDSIRKTLTLDKVVALYRNKNLPKKIAKGVFGYLDTLPGYVDSAFDDDGKEKPQGPDDPPHDLSTCYQQHGFLSMQFTRSLGSLADEYGYIFKQNLADIDINDVVLNRRMMVVMIPILEKSGDEAANLGKIVASSIKGMMGASLGSDVEGSWQDIIENKVTRANSPFVTIFDEVGYYTSQGMAAMAAQARSLGFSLVFAGQDLAAMEKRVKEEAKSITANCNLKIFGKLEDPGPTKDFFEKNVGKIDVVVQKGLELKTGFFKSKVSRKEGLSVESSSIVSYGELRKQGPGHVHMVFGGKVAEVQMTYIQPSKLPAIRMQTFLKVQPGISESFKENFKFSEQLMSKFRNPNWSAAKDIAVDGLSENEILASVKEGFQNAYDKSKQGTETGTVAISNLFSKEDLDEDENLDYFSKFFDDEGDSNKSDDDDFMSLLDNKKEENILDDMDLDDFQKMLDSYKSDDFKDTPPFADEEEVKQIKEDANKEDVYKPTIDLTNTLPWEQNNQDISDEVVNNALNEIWGRDQIDAPIIANESKKEMSGDFVQAMKKYLSPDGMDRKAVVNAILRATADLISDNVAVAGDHAESLKEFAESISEEELETKPEVVEENKEEEMLEKSEKDLENDDISLNEVETEEDFSDFFS
ncbi:MAG: TraM recognition domain-containing protein [Alphaproteobacteria bacterium]|jgi:intracellular multiplication protein IcmO|nr:TraM recognition domain-containing protein [Alphaproteobacteria bacterium]